MPQRPRLLKVSVFKINPGNVPWGQDGPGRGGQDVHKPGLLLPAGNRRINAQRLRFLEVSVFKINPGNVLLSQPVTRQVPSALRGLTAVFGMGTGGSPSP